MHVVCVVCIVVTCAVPCRNVVPVCYGIDVYQNRSFTIFRFFRTTTLPEMCHTTHPVSHGRTPLPELITNFHFAPTLPLYFIFYRHTSNKFALNEFSPLISTAVRRPHDMTSLPERFPSMEAVYRLTQGW